MGFSGDFDETVDEVHKAAVDGAARIKAEIARRQAAGEQVCHNDRISIDTFSQLWGGGQLGFGGLGTAAMTPAQTTIVASVYNRWRFVYFGGRFAYMIERPNALFHEDVRGHRMLPVDRGPRVYEYDADSDADHKKDSEIESTWLPEKNTLIQRSN